MTPRMRTVTSGLNTMRVILSIVSFCCVSGTLSQVSRLKRDTRNYGLMAELNTRPRTTYLAAVLNPNPELPHSGVGKSNANPNPMIREEQK